MYISFENFRGGFERKVPDKIQRRFEQAVEICKCTNFEKKFLKPFIAYGFDTLHIGKLFKALKRFPLQGSDTNK